MIPRLIHQLWGFRDRGEMPDPFRDSVRSWQINHPGWTHIVWDPGMVDRLIDDSYPGFRALYRRYPEWIQRADVARYLILHRHGGIYSDLDILCRRSFQALRSCPVFLPRTAPLGVSNDLMGAEPGTAFMGQVIASLAPAFGRWQHACVPRHVRILLTTGSLRLTEARRRYARQDEIRLLSPALYGNAGCANALVAHLPGNSWMSWDGHLLVFLERCRRRVVGFARETSAGTRRGSHTPAMTPYAMPPDSRAERTDE